MPLRIPLGHRTATLAIDALFHPPSPSPSSARRPSSRISSTSPCTSSPLHTTSPRSSRTLAKIPRQPQPRFPRSSKATTRPITTATATTTSSSSSSSSSSFWKSALTRYSKSANPETLSREEVLHYDEQTITIFDGFDKAKLHFLCLPRIPFRLKRGEEGGRSWLDDEHEEDGEKKKGKEKERGETSPSASSNTPTLSAAGGKLSFGRPSNSRGTDTAIVPPGHLQSLSDLLRSPYAGEVLAALEKAAGETVKRMQEMMPSIPLPSGEKTDCIWDINLGFHAVPSMDTVHLHVITSDLVAERLRNKKHYLSFHPEVGFWQPLSTIQSLHQSGAKSLPRSPHYYESLLRGPLVPLEWRRRGEGMEGGKRREAFGNMPQLKRYLESRWVEEVHARRQGTYPLARMGHHHHHHHQQQKDVHPASPAGDSKVDVDPGKESQTESETESEGQGEKVK